MSQLHKTSIFKKTFPICSFEQANLHGDMYIAVNIQPSQLVRSHMLSFDTFIAFFFFMNNYFSKLLELHN